MAGTPPGRSGSGGPAGLGSQDSQCGRYQLCSPSSAITDGSSTARTTVASSSTATARPTLSCLNCCRESVPKTANTATMMTAALVTTPAVARMPRATAYGVRRPPSCASLIRDTTNTL